jgi:putative membrane protein
MGEAEKRVDVPPGGAAWSEAPGLAARGVCMGTADVVPGVSGGTMALILGIYARLIAAIKSIDVQAARLLFSGKFGEARDRVHWRFLGSVVTGQFLGVVFFTKVVPLPELIHTHPELIYGLFFGLIVASIGVLGRMVVRAGITPGRVAAAVAGLGFGLLVVTLTRTNPEPSAWVVFLCGCVSICAMILPGISGSFVLLILHKYAYVLGAVGEVIHPADGGGRLDPLLTIVGPFALGCLIGLLLFARVLSWLLKRAEHATFAFMTGLMTGSLWVIWPFQERLWEVIRSKRRLISSSPISGADVDGGTLAGALGLAVVGFALVLAMEAYASRGDSG